MSPAGRPRQGEATLSDDDLTRGDAPQRGIVCQFCGHRNPAEGDACENCGAEFSEGTPESPTTFEGRLLGARLGGLTTHGGVSLEPGIDALTAVERMKAQDVDCVVVLDGGRLVGIFTDRDAMLKLAGRDGGALTLQEVMSPNPETLRPDDTVAMAIHKMAVGRVRHLPLVHDDGGVSVVAARDIFRHLVARLH